MKERKTNFHTHTARCLHATGTDEDYVKAALHSGYTLLGFSDHTPWHYESGYIPAGEDCHTDCAGLFVAGDCRSKLVRQLTTATADGTVAATAACEYLDALV